MSVRGIALLWASLLTCLVPWTAAAAEAGSEGSDAPELRLTNVTILVADQEEALRWYTEKLGLQKRADESYGEGERWLTVAAEDSELEIVLQKAPEGAEGNLGESTRWVFTTSDCKRAYEVLKGRGVEFIQPPQELPWAVQSVFRDPFGNEFFLVSSPEG